jgi:hypothetical protein
MSQTGKAFTNETSKAARITHQELMNEIGQGFTVQIDEPLQLNQYSVHNSNRRSSGSTEETAQRRSHAEMG